MIGSRATNTGASCLVAALLALIASTATANNEIMSWVPPYAIAEARVAADADFGLCDARDALTRLGLQFWTPNTDGTIGYADHEWYIPTDGDVAWWRSWCTTNDVECLLTIYNNTGSWDWGLARAAFADNRATFILALVSEMERHGLDGIDLDLEGIGSLDADRMAFAAFVSELSGELRSRGKILTIDSFHYIWNAPNQGWWPDWIGQIDNIHSMGYDDLYEGGSTYQPYSFQQSTGIAAGYPADFVMMGMPSWLGSWGTSSGRGTAAAAHVQEIRLDLPEPTGIAIWDLQLSAWMDSDLWCEIISLRETGAATVLLRNDDVTRLDPVTPGLETILPLDPAADLHRDPFVPGAEVPADGGPLVFFEVPGPHVIRLSRPTRATIRIDD